MSFMKTGIRVIALAALTMALASTAQADRRTGMYGNLLITDQDDLWFFPQDVLTYRNRISLDYGAGSGAGNGLFTMGDESSAFGLAIHRGDVTIPGAAYFDGPSGAAIPGAALANPASPITPGGMFTRVSPSTMVDLMYAMDSGLGMRLAFGPASDKDVADSETGDSEFYLLGTVGYGTGVRGEDGRYDFSGSVLFDAAGSVNGGEDTRSAAVFALSGLFRGFMPMDETMDMGLLGAVGLSNSSVSFDDSDPTVVSSLTTFGVTGGVGPSFRFGDASVAAYGTVALNVTALEPNDQVDNDEIGTATIVIPGVNVAVEVPLNDWFYVRSGADYRWQSFAAADTDGNGNANASTLFGWNAGVGVTKNGWSFDGALSHGFVTGGPNFISGAAGNLFLMANMTYDFNDARSGVVPAEEPAEEAAEEAAEEEATEPAAPAPIEPAPVDPVPADPSAPAPAPAVAPAPAPVAPLPLPAAPPGQ